MIIALGSDMATPLLTDLADLIQQQHHTPQVLTVPQPWATIGLELGCWLRDGEAAMAIAMCWTGTGVCMAANRMPSVRAALCTDAATAEGARRWNDANMLCLSLRLTTTALATEILTAWLATSYDGEEDACLAQLSTLYR